MTPIDSTNDQNTMRSFLKLHLHINNQNTHQRKNLKLPYLNSYNIVKIWIEIERVET